MEADVLLIGGGAAGFFCAVNIARASPGTSVAILEKSSKLLSKVRISGGGRCNITHDCRDNSALIQNYPRGAKALRQAFSRFAVADTIRWFEENGVSLKTEEDGRMFPVTDSSETVITCFQSLARRYNVRIITGCEVHSLRAVPNGIILGTAKGEMRAKMVVCAAGGHPKAGAYDYIGRTGHTIVKPVPSLFTFNLPKDSICRLPGVSVTRAQVRLTGTKLSASGPVLVTHWGLSGPAVLRLSAFGAEVLNGKSYDAQVAVNWTALETKEDVTNALIQMKTESGKPNVKTRNPFQIPARLWEYLLDRAGVDGNKPWAETGNRLLASLAEKLFADGHHMVGKTTYKEEFVTCGGVELDEVDFRSMESRIVPGLYFCGEVLNIDGVTGGFNFQAAWTTAWIAAENIAGKLSGAK